MRHILATIHKILTNNQTMSNYIRSRFGITFFFTLVTFQRRKILCLEPCRTILRNAIKNTQTQYPFIIDAIVLLPEHLHCIWTLPENDMNYSRRWAIIKREFSKHAQPIIAAMVENGLLSKVQSSKSRIKHREATIWQRRFWEHTIRDDEDMKNHVEYIHYNPVKHGLTASPLQWEFSSFHRYVADGLYLPDWGREEDMEFKEDIGQE